MSEPRVTLATWPRLLDVHLAATYTSCGEQTIRDWVIDGLLTPIAMPGSTLRDRAGNVIAPASRRRISKILIAREDLDRLIDERKGAA